MNMEKLSVPIAIVIAGILIAVALYYSNINPPKQVVNTAPTGTSGDIEMRAITSEDHILGNPNADIIIVEYSDLECPYCKAFHSTLKQVMADYGSNGKVAWVYRHFPIDQLHSKARKEAEATECANELGGNDKFWAYTDRLFEVTPTNNGLDPAELPKIATYVGLDTAKFTQCLESGKYASKIEAEVQAAVAAGARGTPYSVVISASGKKSVIPGALPYEQVKGIIDAALQN